MASTVTDRARTMWCMRLQSAIRTAVACAIVGCATIYGPKFLVDEIKFAAFSYLTAVLIVSDASLGDAVRGCWHALCATVQVVPLAVVGRRVVDGQLPVGMGAVTVAVAAFVVALPGCTHLTAKRIAFGQIVLVCSDAVYGGGMRDGFMHPVYVAASTALGALASVLALLIPYPGLAYYKVQKLHRIYAENASQIVNIYLRAFSAHENRTKMELISQAKPLAETGVKLSQSIRTLLEGMQWERPWCRYSKHNREGIEDRLQNIELQIRGIEYALLSSSTLPVHVVEQEELSNVLKGASTQLGEKLEQVRHFPHFHSKPEPETQGEFHKRTSLPVNQNLPILEHRWVFFYFSCIDMLLNDATGTHKFPREFQSQQGKTDFDMIRTFKAWIVELTSKERLEFALKCSLSLSLAVLFGLIFDKENGCWAGLAIAISFVKGRQAIFTIANTRAQGTAIGTAYGVICCFVFHHEEVRLFALLPWIIFTSFLRYSKMYGQTGGVSAAIGALLILGRKNYGAPNEFAIARLTEVFIGLSAFILVEIFLQPIRAATLAKNHLLLTLCSIQDFMKGITIYAEQENQTVENFLELREKQRNLDHLICELEKFVADAELEPDFWYLPFRGSCYQKQIQSLSTIVDMLHFTTYNLNTLSEPYKTSTVCKQLKEQISSKLEIFQETLSTSKVCLKKALPPESPTDSQMKVDEEFWDREVGKLQNQGNFMVFITEHKVGEETTDEEDCERKNKLRESMIQCLGATEFCINSLMKEIDDTAICIREIGQWENRSNKKI